MKNIVAEDKFRGNAVYTILTWDVVVGDEVCFTKSVFSGFGKSCRHVGYDIVTGIVIRESYGAKSQQHTFSILVGATTLRIKGRNLYRNGCWRKAWEDESKRDEICAEKHERGSKARAKRAARKNIELGLAT